MPGIDRARLAGEWFHSHEEDSDGRTVYRLKGHAFPPSRGRSGFSLAADGSASEFGPDAGDKPASANAHWQLQAGGVLAIYPAGSAAPSRSLQIDRQTDDMLVVTRKTAGG